MSYVSSLGPLSLTDFNSPRKGQSTETRSGARSQQSKKMDQTYFEEQNREIEQKTAAVLSEVMFLMEKVDAYSRNTGPIEFPEMTQQPETKSSLIRNNQISDYTSFTSGRSTNPKLGSLSNPTSTREKTKSVYSHSSLFN